MKVYQLFCYGLAIAFCLSACSNSKDDPMPPSENTTYFNWDVGNESFDGAVTGTYAGSALIAWAESRDDQGVQLKIRAVFDEAGTIRLNKNDSDPDDNNLLEYINHGDRYITTTTHFIELNITAINENDQQIKGNFSGEVVNIDDSSDVKMIENGEFVIGYF